MVTVFISNILEWEVAVITVLRYRVLCDMLCAVKLHTLCCCCLCRRLNIQPNDGMSSKTTTNYCSANYMSC